MKSKLHDVGLVAGVIAPLLATVVATLVATPARADRGSSEAGSGNSADIDDDAGDIDDDGRHVAVAAGWAALELAIPAWYYWRTQDAQEVDWTRPSWKDKLTLHSV